MADSYNEYTAPGGTTDFAFTPSFLAQAHIKASLDGVDQVLGVDYNIQLVPTVEVQFVVAPTAGVTVRCYRETPISTAYVSFVLGASLQADDLNNMMHQMLFLAQENIDNPPVGGGGGGGVTDHGALTGRADDDHTQYHTDARALAWLASRTLDDLPNSATYGKVTLAEIAEIAVNTAKISYTDAAAVALNTAKTSYDGAAQAEMALNNAKISYDAAAQAEMVVNNAKVSFDVAAQAAAALNTAKISYDAAAQAEMAANNAKISYTDAAAVALNTAKLTANTANVAAAGALMDTDVVALENNLFCVSDTEFGNSNQGRSLCVKLPFDMDITEISFGWTHNKTWTDAAHWEWRAEYVPSAGGNTGTSLSTLWNNWSLTLTNKLFTGTPLRSQKMTLTINQNLARDEGDLLYLAAQKVGSAGPLTYRGFWMEVRGTRR